MSLEMGSLSRHLSFPRCLLLIALCLLPSGPQPCAISPRRGPPDCSLARCWPFSCRNFLDVPRCFAHFHVQWRAEGSLESAVKVAIPRVWSKIWISLSPRQPRGVAMRFRKTLTFLILATGLVFALPAWAQQKSVGPSSAGPRPNAVRPHVACGAAMPALPPRAQQKPFTQEQVSNMVRDGFGDESGAKVIEQRGIDFAPSEDSYQTLKAAGASEETSGRPRRGRNLPQSDVSKTHRTPYLPSLLCHELS